MDSKTLNVPSRTIAAVLLALSALFAGLGWLAYRTNLDSFSQFEEAGHKIQATGNYDVSFYCDEAGKYQPATLWQTGRTQFMIAIQLLILAIALLLWRRRPVADSRTSDGPVSEDATA